MVTAMRVASDKVGEGGKAMATATSVAGERTAAATKRAMGMKTREVGVEEGSKDSKSHSDGEEEGTGEEDGNWFSSFVFQFPR
jgi:hypothetical protein